MEQNKLIEAINHSYDLQTPSTYLGAGILDGEICRGGSSYFPDIAWDHPAKITETFLESRTPDNYSQGQKYFVNLSKLY